MEKEKRGILFDELMLTLENKINEKQEFLQCKINNIKSELTYDQQKVTNMEDLCRMLSNIPGIIVYGGSILLMILSIRHSYEIFNKVSEMEMAMFGGYIPMALGLLMGVYTGCAKKTKRETRAMLSKLIVDRMQTISPEREKSCERMIQNCCEQQRWLGSQLLCLNWLNKYFNCMFTSDLKEKTFSEKEIKKILALLETENIINIIYLIYHDNLDALEHMNDNDKQRLNHKIKYIAEQVMNEYVKLETECIKRCEQANGRVRRIDRFHSYSYDMARDEVAKKIRSRKM